MANNIFSMLRNPDIKNPPLWWWGTTPKPEIIALLHRHKGAKGLFLVRASFREPSGVALSVVDDDSVTHHLITVDEHGSFQLNKKQLPPEISCFEDVLNFLNSPHPTRTYEWDTPLLHYIACPSEYIHTYKREKVLVTNFLNIRIDAQEIQNSTEAELKTMSLDDLRESVTALEELLSQKLDKCGCLKAVTNILHQDTTCNCHNKVKVKLTGMSQRCICRQTWLRNPEILRVALPAESPDKIVLDFDGLSNFRTSEDVESWLIYPKCPNSVRMVLDKKVDNKLFSSNAEWKQVQFDPVVKWLLNAISLAHMSEKVKLLARRVLNVSAFTKNMEAAASENPRSSAFVELMDGLDRRRNQIGDRMKTMFDELQLGVKLSNKQLDRFLTRHPLFSETYFEEAKQKHLRWRSFQSEAELYRDLCRQDRLVPLVGCFHPDAVDWNKPQAYMERKFLHVLTLICAALNGSFQNTVRRACGRFGKSIQGPLKTVARMLNKMFADDSHEMRPRCARQIDIMRSRIQVSSAEELKEVLAGIQKEFGGGFAYFKNLFDIPIKEAEKRKHIRMVMVTVVFQPQDMTYGKLVSIPETTDIWKKHRNNPSGEPSERWKRLTDHAIAYLKQVSIADHQVGVLAEIQITLKEYISCLSLTGEVYKAARCRKSCGELYSQFKQALEEMESPTPLRGDTLGHAARLGQADTVKSMLAQPDIQINGLWTSSTAAFLAAEGGHVDVLHELAARNADFNKANYYGNTPLMIAIEKEHDDVVRYLVSCESVNVDLARPDDNCTPLYYACYKGDLACVQLLVEANATIDKRSKEDYTGVLIATRNGHLDIVKFLVDCGANVDLTVDKFQAKPLILAAQGGFTDVVNFLCGLDIVNPNYAMTNGATAVHIACQSGNLNVVETLADHGASLELRTAGGAKTPLFMSAQDGNYEIVKYLVHKRAEVNVKTREGWTPLHAAVSGKHSSVIKLLLEWGADASIGNVLQLAETRKLSPSLIENIREHILSPPGTYEEAIPYADAIPYEEAIPFASDCVQVGVNSPSPRLARRDSARGSTATIFAENDIASSDNEDPTLPRQQPVPKTRVRRFQSVQGAPIPKQRPQPKPRRFQSFA
eukprot:m.343076 g.343076  ORF g.343076 m.343076 type:complete len:1108 (-) comp22325_c0_seq1:136-3459(-)